MWHEMKGRKEERNGKEEANWHWHWLIDRLLIIVGWFDKIGHLKKFEKKKDINNREGKRGEEKRTLETIARVCIYGRCGRCMKLGEPD